MKHTALNRSSSPNLLHKPQTAQSAKEQSAPNGVALAQGKLTNPAALLQLQQTMGNRAVQRLMGGSQKTLGNRSKSQTLNSLQRATEAASTVGAEGGFVSGEVQGAIDHARGGGQVLDKGASTKLGGAMGADFSGVRVHTDSQSDSINRSLGAEAATVGDDIFFSKGAYNPSSASGQKLLAHELTHVAQQGGAAKGVQPKLRVGAAHDSYEQQAETVSDNFANKQPSTFKPAQPGLVQRKMAFTRDKLQSSGKKSTMGIKLNESKLEILSKALNDYWDTREAAQESQLLGVMVAMTLNWLNKTKNNRKPERASVFELNLAASKELPKAKRQAEYMKDMSAGSGKFNYLSKHGPDVVPDAQGLAQGGGTKHTRDLISTYHLTDAEIAAIKLYTADDYKYVNPAMKGDDSWLKDNLPHISGLGDARGGSAEVLNTMNLTLNRKQNQYAIAKIERGQLGLGYGVRVSRAEEEVAGQGVVVSLESNNLGAVPATDATRFGAGATVRLQLDKFGHFQSKDQLSFADATPTGLAEAKAEGLRHGKITKQGLKKLPDFKGQLFRGMTLTSDDFNKDYKKGGILDYPNFTSTTKDIKLAESFIKRELLKDKGRGGNKLGVLLRLDVQEKGKDVSKLSQAENEKEVLLMQKTLFQVTDNPTKNTDKGYLEVTARQVTAAEQLAEKQRKEEEDAARSQRPGAPTKSVPQRNKAKIGTS